MKIYIFLILGFGIFLSAHAGENVAKSIAPEVAVGDILKQSVDHFGQAIKCGFGTIEHGLKGGLLLLQGVVKVGQGVINFAEKNPAIVLTCIGAYGSWRVYRWWSEPNDANKKRRA
jgi:hypothetical protein